MKTKRFIALMISLIMVLSMLPFAAFALNATDKISTVKLKISEPSAGQSVNLSFSSVELGNSMEYKVIGLSWYKNNESVKMGVDNGADTYFIGGNSYTVKIDLEAKTNDGWNIDEYRGSETDYSGINATLNGKPAEVVNREINGNYRTICVKYTFDYIPDGIINYPSISIPTPIAGNLPPEKEDLKVGDPRATWLPSTDYLWYVYENNAWRKMEQNEHFVAGARYKVELAIQTNEGFRFNIENADDYRNDGGKQIWGYINGDKRTMALKALGAGQYDDEIVFVTYEFTSCEAQYVDSVSFSGLVAPSATQHPQYNPPAMTGSYTLFDDEEFTGGAQFNFVNGIQWTSVNGLLDATSVFEMGGVYSMTFFIKTFDTHRFTDWVDGNANIGYVDVMVLPDDPTIAMVTVTFAPCDGGVLSEVNISGIKNPVHGEAPDYVFTYGQGYDLGTSADAIVWYDLTANKKLLSTDTFVYGHEYELRIILRSEKQILGASNGKFEFASHDALTVKANGTTATKLERYNNNPESNWVLASIPFECEKHTIEQLVITVDNPAEGMHPARQVEKGDDTYNIKEFIFVDCDTDMGLNAEDVFAGGKSYRFVLAVTPKEGFKFENGITAAKVNGQDAGFIYADESGALITYVFISEEAPYCLITFNEGEGSGYMNDIILKGSMLFVLPECEFEAPDGKHFIGWSNDYGESILHGVSYYLEGITTLNLMAVYESDDVNEHVHIYSPNFNAHDDLSHYKTCVSPTCPEFGSDSTKSTAPGDEIMHQYDNDCDDTCDDCGYVRSLNNAGNPLHFYEHECSEVCPNCGLAREAAPHTPGAHTSCTDEQRCTVCNKLLIEAIEHTPGAEATCTEPQKCTVCGAELKAANGHSAGVEWITDENGHHKLCSCGEKVEAGAHVDENDDKICDICGYKAKGGFTDDGQDKNGLGAGAIIAIVIGSVLVVGIGGFALLWFAIKKKSFSDLKAVFKKK